MDFHDIPVVDRPCYVEMKQFIDNEGQFCPFILAINGKGYIGRAHRREAKCVLTLWPRVRLRCDSPRKPFWQPQIFHPDAPLVHRCRGHGRERA